jgi:hypothetical protein
LKAAAVASGGGAIALSDGGNGTAAAASSLSYKIMLCNINFMIDPVNLRVRFGETEGNGF